MGIETVIRPKNWDEFEAVLDKLQDAKREYLLLGFACIEVTKDDVNYLRSKGCVINEVDYEKLLNNKKEMDKYLAYVDQRFERDINRYCKELKKGSKAKK